MGYKPWCHRDKHLNVSGDFMEDRRVPSAIHLLTTYNVHTSQNEVLGISSVFVTLVQGIPSTFGVVI